MERRRADDGRDSDRGSRDRDDRGRDDRGSRDRDDRGSSRGRDDRGSRDRDDRGGRESSRGGRDDDRGSSRGGGSSYRYQERSAEDVRQRATNDSKFDKMLKPHIKGWTPNGGDNRIRILPPTWEGAKHYGLDIYVHYGVGADRQSYLDLFKMLGKPDPIHEEYEQFRKTADMDDPRDKEYARELGGTQRVLVYLIDRDNEKEGVQAWAMPRGLDMDIVKISQDKTSGEVLQLDNPEEGYDVIFERNGRGKNTKYEGVTIARRSSPLGKSAWLDFAVENPLPDQLVYFDYEHIAKEFGGAGEHRGGRSDGDRGGRDDRRDADRDDRGSRDRDDRGSSRDRDDRGGRDDRAPRDRDERPSRDEPVINWATVHEMTARELEDLIEDKRLKINPKEAKDDADLADWVCEEMGLKKSERRVADDSDPTDTGRRVAGAGDKDLDTRMADMRNRRRD